MSTPPGSAGGNLIPDGRRVGRPVRSRTRASRRTPPTLVSTDVENFRAMVQHFTAGPNASAAAPPGPGPHLGEPNLGFGFGERQQPHVNAGISLMVPPADMSHLQYQQQMVSQLQHQNQAYMFSLNNYNPGAGSYSFKDMGEP
ncbi:VQ motif-containing protein 22-like [Hibiscus syriacus]|uniref:VQ motif-containing protein 22-like n=1 Tax=Hibiscus syriacus TaxID=106335 RepID=UPI001920BD84|nr:VQ motif-containing protein 22-like [Hibiscus syriacus]